MADEVKWGRVREWDGTKGCPPVAVGKLCAAMHNSGMWYRMERPNLSLGQQFTWCANITAYRIPAEFDHLDDNGSDMKRWSDVFKPVEDGVGPEGVSLKTHEIQYTSDGFHWFKPASFAKWNTNCGYRYRPLQTPDLEGNPPDPFANHTSAELRAAADAKDTADEAEIAPWRELALRVKHPITGMIDPVVLRNGAAEILGVTL